MALTRVMLQLPSFQHLPKAKGSWEISRTACVLTKIAARVTKREAIPEGWLWGEAHIPHPVQSREPEMSGCCGILLTPPTRWGHINRLHGTSYIFATHILGIKYSFLTSPSKVTGKWSNSRVTMVGRLEECKKIPWIWDKNLLMCLTFMTVYLPLHSSQMKAHRWNTAWESNLWVRGRLSWLALIVTYRVYATAANRCVKQAIERPCLVDIFKTRGGSNKTALSEECAEKVQ